MARDPHAHFDFRNNLITTDPRPDDPGPEWLVWAQQLRVFHNEHLHHMQQLSEATARNTEAFARIGLLEEQMRDQSVSHSEVHDMTKAIREDLHRLSDAVGTVERYCNVEFNRTSRRFSIVDKQQEALLHAVERGKSQVEKSAPNTHNQDPLRNSVINAASAIPTPVAGQHIPLGHFSVSSDGLGMSQSLEGSSRAGLHDQSYRSVPSQEQVDEIQAALPRNESPPIRQRSDRARAYEPELAQRDDREPQSFYELDEYIVIRGDTIETILRDVEKKLVKDFINDMNDADQRTMLVERLNHTAWTWKTAKQEATAIRQAELDPQGIRGLAGRWAAEAAGIAEAEEEAEGAEEAERETQQPASKARVQRKTRRRRKNW